MKTIVSSIAIAAMLISGSMAYAEEGKHPAPPAGLDVHFGFPGTQGLNELLVKKGIVTKEELEAQAKKHSLNIAGYIQVQGSIIGNNDELTNETSPKSFADEDGFRIRRAKLAVFGYAYEHVKFKLEANFAGTTPALDDAYIEDDRLPFFIGRLGQFKVPFSLEELTSDTEILSIERSEVAKQIAPGRDQGISFSGAVTGGLLSYSIGAYNGTKAGTATTYKIGAYEDAARNATRNDNDQLLYAGRLVVKPVEWLNLGISGLTSAEGTGTASMNHNAYGIDLQVKNPKRGCSLQGEYLRQWLKDAADKTTTSDGFYLQAGHFLVEKHLEAVVKYEEYDSNKDIADRDDIRWATVGLNFYIYGNHDAKLMANYILKDEKQNGNNNNTFLTQLQLRF